MDDIKLLAFIKKELDREQEKKVLDWIEQSEENRAEYNSLKNIWALSSSAGEGQLSGTLPDARVLTTLAGTGAGRGIVTVFRYAAVIITLIALSFLANHYLKSPAKGSTSFHTISSPPGQTTNITLADGSVVSMNSGTVIRVPENYSSGNRRIDLDGEAFFEIESDKKHPFTVRASGICVVATGTGFNVDAYGDEDRINVTLVSGMVDLCSSGGEMIAHLKPGENAMINVQTEELNIAEVNTDFFTSWQRGLISFSNRRLEDIARDLERWYCVEIIFMSEECKEIRYSGTILKHKPVDQVLEILQLTSDFEYEMEVMDNKLSKITIKK